MLKIDESSVKGLEFNFELDSRQQGVLAAAVKQEWFDILQKLMEQEVRLLNIKLLNTPSNATAGILANHAVARGAGMFYAGVMQRLAHILQVDAYNAQGIGTPENPEVPPYLDEVTPQQIDN